MKHDRRAFLIVELILAVAAGVMLLRMSTGQETKRKISVIVNQPDKDRWELFLYGVKQAAEEYGIDAVITTADSISDTDQEEELMEDAVADGAEALIVQPAPGTGSGSALEKISARVPVVETAGGASGGSADETSTLSASSEREKKDGGPLIVVNPDYESMGCSLAQMLVDDSGNLKGKRIGIISGQTDEKSISEMKKGIESVFGGKNCRIIWELDNLAEGEDGLTELGRQDQADFIIALDTQTVEQCGEALENGSIQNTSLYGIGMSTKAIYYLDRGMSKGMVIPGCYEMGYQAVREAEKGLRSGVGAMQSVMTDYRIVRREDLFTTENEQLLFSLDQ